MRAVLQRAGLSSEAVDLYIFGNVLRSGHGQLLPRQAAFKAGIPETANGYAVDMVCSSGMMGVISASMAIASGDADVVLAGGMESMSQSGLMLSHRVRVGLQTAAG